MAETVTDTQLNATTEDRYRYNTSVSVGSTITTLLSASDSRLYRAASIVVYNHGEAGTLTVKVWVSNNETAGTLGTASDGWAQLGDDITISSGSSSNKQWIGRYRRTGVTATVSSGTGTADVWIRELL
jgi:hypothetical protein